MLSLTASRVLGRGSAAVIGRVLASRPIESCLIASRFEQVGMDRSRLGGQFWGVSGGRDALCFDGPNLIPVTGNDHAMRLFAYNAARHRRRCASVIGPAELVLPLWSRLEESWGRPRDLRPNQPLLACAGPVACAQDGALRTVRPEELDRYFPAAVAMFTEEVGVDPRQPDGGSGYRSRVESLIRSRRAFARFDTDGEVMVKAEIGALSSRVALIQGVWVAPRWRGRGLAAPAIAAIVGHVKAMGRIPSLYVNDHNVVARSVYRTVGFTQVGTFASVLF